MDIKVKEEVLDVHEDDSGLFFDCDIVKEETTIQEANVPVQRRETATNGELVNYEITEIELKVETKDGHKCKVCKKIFPNVISLDTHMLVHKKFKCKICLRTFKYKSNLQTHGKSHTEAPAPCGICKKIMKNSASMRVHMSTRHGPPKKAKEQTTKIYYECEKCGKVLSSKYSLIGHMQRMHESAGERKFLTCTICDLTFKKKSNHKRHMALHSLHPENDFPCEMCNKRFMLKELLQRHRETLCLNNEALIKCIYCSKSYQKRSALQAHMKAHHRGLPKMEGAIPSCTICRKVSKNLENLKKHVDEVHPKKRKKFECAICGVKTKCKSTIHRHIMKVHLKIPDFRNRKDTKCPVCSISLAKRYLRGHMITHSTDRPFACDTCGKKYKTKKQLQVHNFSHVAFKNNQGMKCGYCEKIFYLKNTLVIHTRDRHRGLPVNARDPPFKCTICQKSYEILDELKEHVTTHRIDFNCGICGNIFSAESSLRRHVRNIHQRKKLP